MPKWIDRTGQKFHRLLIMERITGQWWRCLCDCGVSYIGSVHSIVHGNTKSCGCLNLERIRERNTKHGMSVRGRGNPTYHAWVAAKQRCYNKRSIRYPLYGGRGIAMCDRWRGDFAAFLADMGERPSSRHSLDRINVNGNYEPGNCRWATQAEQVRNTRRSVRVPINGTTMPAKDAAALVGLNYGTVIDRIARGWPLDQVLRPKLQTWNRGRKRKAA